MFKYYKNKVKIQLNEKIKVIIKDRDWEYKVIFNKFYFQNDIIHQTITLYSTQQFVCFWVRRILEKEWFGLWQTCKGMIWIFHCSIAKFTSLLALYSTELWMLSTRPDFVKASVVVNWVCPNWLTYRGEREREEHTKQDQIVYWPS